MKRLLVFSKPQIGRPTGTKRKALPTPCESSPRGPGSPAAAWPWPCGLHTQAPGGSPDPERSRGWQLETRATLAGCGLACAPVGSINSGQRPSSWPSQDTTGPFPRRAVQRWGAGTSGRNPSNFHHREVDHGTPSSRAGLRKSSPLQACRDAAAMVTAPDRCAHTVQSVMPPRPGRRAVTPLSAHDFSTRSPSSGLGVSPEKSAVGRATAGSHDGMARGSEGRPLNVGGKPCVPREGARPSGHRLVGVSGCPGPSSAPRKQPRDAVGC